MTFGILALRIWSLCRFWVPAIFMHSLGDVWHLGSEDLESLPGVPALQDLEDLESLGPSVTCCTLSSYLYAFLR